MSIAQQDKPRLVAERPHQPFHHGQVDHRALVDNDHTLGQPVVLMMEETAGSLRVTEQAMERARLGQVDQVEVLAATGQRSCSGPPGSPHPGGWRPYRSVRPARTLHRSHPAVATREGSTGRSSSCPSRVRRRRSSSGIAPPRCTAAILFSRQRDRTTVAVDRPRRHVAQGVLGTPQETRPGWRRRFVRPAGLRQIGFPGATSFEGRGTRRRRPRA